jgi:hypothetical protein
MSDSFFLQLYVGSRATGNSAGDFLVGGPDWIGQTPSGINGVIDAAA